MLKLIHDNFAPGDKIVDVENPSGAVLMQAYVTRGRRAKMLIVNKRDHEIRMRLAGARGGNLEVVDQTTASNPPASAQVDSRWLQARRLCRRRRDAAEASNRANR